MGKTETNKKQYMTDNVRNIPVTALNGDVPSLTGVQLCTLVSFLKKMFDIVYIVKPQNCEQYEVDDRGELHKVEGLCFDNQSKGACCENCISAAVLRAHRAMTRIEFVNNRLYGVTASTIIVNDEEYVLELVSYADCKIESDDGSGGILEAITEHSKRLYIDSVTGVYNRRYFDDVLSKLEGRFSFAMLDLDNFKQINDSFGHTAGDIALAAVACALKECIGSDGDVVRYGGDEFFLFFGKMSESEMRERLESILHMVENTVIAEFQGLKVTISIGGASSEGKLSHSIRNADAAMYQAKETRNSIKMYED